MIVDLPHLLNILDLEELDKSLFRGEIMLPDRPHVFGGQVLGQALVAASRTVPEERRVHSMHAYFLRPGDHRHPIIYDTEAIRDGGSFTTRRVVAKQHGEAIFISSMSFKEYEDGFEHQIEMPDVPEPESLEPDRVFWERVAPNHHRQNMTALDTRSIHRRAPDDTALYEPSNGVWFKAEGKLPDETIAHEAVLAFATDMGLLSTAFRPHPIATFQAKGFQAASLDHTIWLHQPIKVDEWLYYQMDSTRAANATGLCRGSIYTRDGVLVASTAQEGLMRVRKNKQ